MLEKKARQLFQGACYEEQTDSVLKPSRRAGVHKTAFMVTCRSGAPAERRESLIFECIFGGEAAEVGLLGEHLSGGRGGQTGKPA